MNVSDYKQMLSRTGINVGRAHKTNSDMIMEATWDRDIQSQTAYIYSYEKDDLWWKNKGYDPSKSISKIPIDIKFIKTTSQSMDKDQVSFMVQFKPSQKLKFKQGDDMYYYEELYTNRYNSTFPLGLYLDIMDENGEYHKWLICAKTIDNQFVKYLVLPTNYLFTWVVPENGKRVVKRMWGCMQSQNSYNSGLTL